MGKGAFCGSGVPSLGSPDSRLDEPNALGFEYPPELSWKDWRPGEEIEKQIVLKNVGIKAAIICYKPPQSRLFSVPLPETRRVPPGLTWSIPVIFRPQNDEPIDEQLEVYTENGSFRVLLRAKGGECAICIPEAIDFGGVAVGRKTTKNLAVQNTGSDAVVVRWRATKPFNVTPAVFELPAGKSATCFASFNPDATCTFSAVAICELLAPSSFTPSISKPRRSTPAALHGDISRPEGAGEPPGFLESTRGKDSVEEAGGFAIGRVVKTYQMQLKGFGKIPYLLIEGKTKQVVDFGCLHPGEVQTRNVTLTNTSPVLAEYEVR